MTESVVEYILKAPEHLTVGNVIDIGGIPAPIEKIVTNKNDEIVLHLTNPQAIHKLRSKLMLIVPKGIAIYIRA